MKPIGSFPLLNRFHIISQSGVAFTVQKGQIIRVIDVEGEQVSDLVCFAQQDIEEHLSTSRTIDYNEKIYLSEGDVLYSNLSNPMLMVMKDKVGKHDLLFAPCSQEMFRRTYKTTEPHPNCLDNLASHLAQFGIRASQIPTAFNAFMHVAVSERGELTIKPPRSKAGDYIDLRAEMDLIVGVSACSAGKCNNYRCTAIEVEAYAGE